jgi:hypothetical protein
MVCRITSLLILLTAAGPGILASEPVPVTLAEGTGSEGPKQPQAFVSENGTVDVVYAAGENILVSTSHDGGSTFKSAAGSIHCPNLSAGMRRGPRLVRTGNRLVVSGIGGKQGKGRDGDLFAWHSDDEGATWSEPVMVNDVQDAAREGLHAMTSAPDGTVYCVWLDLRNKMTEVCLSRSTDEGSTWSKNSVVYRSPDGSVCECCHPSIAVNSDTVAVMFRNSLEGNRDMYVAVSKDQGVSFKPAKKLGTGTWPLDACPMDGGMVAIDSKGTLLTVWRRDKELYSVAGPGHAETLLGRGEQPWIAASGSDPVIVWTTGREGTLMIQKAGHKPRHLAETARQAAVSTPSSGAGPAVVVWESTHGRHSAVMAVRVE